MYFGHFELEAFLDVPDKDMQVWALDESSRLEGGGYFIIIIFK